MTGNTFWLNKFLFILIAVAVNSETVKVLLRKVLKQGSFAGERR